MLTRRRLRLVLVVLVLLATISRGEPRRESALCGPWGAYPAEMVLLLPACVDGQPIGR